MRGCIIIAWITIPASGDYTPPTPSNVFAYQPNSTVVAVGGIGGSLTFFDSANATRGQIASYPQGPLDVISLAWSPVARNVLASVSADNRVAIRKFVNNSTLASTQTFSIQHHHPLLTCSWDLDTGSRLLLGTATGFIDEYNVSFAGLSGTFDTPIDSVRGRTMRWFAGCYVSYILSYNSTHVMAGCREGQLKYFDRNSSIPTNTISFVVPVPVAYKPAFFSAFRGVLRVLFLDTVYGVDYVGQAIMDHFEIHPYRIPSSVNGHDIVLSFDATWEQLVVRTQAAIVQYDMWGIFGDHVPINRWVTNVSLSDLIGMGAKVSWSVRTLSQADYNPFVEVDASIGAIDVAACWTAEASFNQANDKRNVVCVGEPPVVTIDVQLPFAYSIVRGNFSMQSLGTIPAQDCSALKGPITEWDATQRSQWIKGANTSSVDISICPRVSDTPISRAYWSVADCKAECLNRPECNMISVIVSATPLGNALLPDEGRMIDTCNFHRCPSPNQAPAPPNGVSEVWTLTTASRYWMYDKTKPLNNAGGYVACGTPSAVLYGGCGSPDGLIPSNSTSDISLPDSPINPMESVVRFQVSQYNAEARVRISDLRLDFYVPYAEYRSYTEESNSPPGGNWLATSALTGGPQGPILLTPDGTGLITTMGNTSIGLYPLG